MWRLQQDLSMLQVALKQHQLIVNHLFVFYIVSHFFTAVAGRRSELATAEHFRRRSSKNLKSSSGFGMVILVNLVSKVSFSVFDVNY